MKDDVIIMMPLLYVEYVCLFKDPWGPFKVTYFWFVMWPFSAIGGREHITLGLVRAGVRSRGICLRGRKAGSQSPPSVWVSDSELDPANWVNRHAMMTQLCRGEDLGTSQQGQTEPQNGVWLRREVTSFCSFLQSAVTLELQWPLAGADWIL